MEVKIIEWSEESVPVDSCRYNHLKGKTPIGEFLITWKGWKKFCSYEVELNGYYRDSLRTLGDAKEEAQKIYSEIVMQCMMEAVNSDPHAKAYEDVYNSFWRGIVEKDDGSLDKDEVMRALYDYHRVMNEVSEVYAHITGNQISKPNTYADVVIAAVDDYYHDSVRDAVYQ